MNTNVSSSAKLSHAAAVTLYLLLAVPALAQQEPMPGMQMPQPAKSSSMSASASSSGQTMQGVDMSSMPNMRKPAHPAKPKKQKHEHAVAPGSASSTQSTQSKDMSATSGMQMPMHHAPPQSAPTPASSSMQSMPGMEMHDTDRWSKPGMQMPGMQSMPKQPSKPVELQHLDFGNMIGVRPKLGGLAESSHGMQMNTMENMDMSSMQGGKAPPDARSPDYSDGYRYTDMPGMAMSDHALIGMLLLDQLEYAYDNHGRSAAFLDGEAWYGEDFNKLWLKAEGEYAQGKLEDLRTEALWSHAVSTYWGTQLGLRHDFGGGPGRTWAALGIQGLAPFWFDTEATLYVGEEGRAAARVQFEYEELITQRLVLQPKIEANFYGKSDPQRGIGAGLSDSELGVRLRYEFRREFGPYIGVAWRRRYGRSADLARAQGHPAGELQFVAGVHAWF